MMRGRGGAVKKRADVYGLAVLRPNATRPSLADARAHVRNHL